MISLAYDAPIPRLTPLGIFLDRPNVSEWRYRRDDETWPVPFMVIVQSKRARVLRWLSRGRISAVALGDRILVAERYPDPELLGHEAVHCWQFWSEAGGSLVLFLALYATKLRHGYNAHPWEIEANLLGPRIAQQFVAEHSQ